MGYDTAAQQERLNAIDVGLVRLREEIQAHSSRAHILFSSSTAKIAGEWAFVGGDMVANRVTATAVIGKRVSGLRKKYTDVLERLDCESTLNPKWMRDANQAIIDEGIRVLESDLEILQEMFNLLGGGIDDLRRIIG